MWKVLVHSVVWTVNSPRGYRGWTLFCPKTGAVPTSPEGLLECSKYLDSHLYHMSIQQGICLAHSIPEWNRKEAGHQIWAPVRLSTSPQASQSPWAGELWDCVQALGGDSEQQKEA